MLTVTRWLSICFRRVGNQCSDKIVLIHVSAKAKRINAGQEGVSRSSRKRVILLARIFGSRWPARYTFWYAVLFGIIGAGRQAADALIVAILFQKN
jgi:hypothetical protein